MKSRSLFQKKKKCEQVIQHSEELNKARLEKHLDCLYHQLDNRLQAIMDQLNKANEKIQQVNKI